MIPHHKGEIHSEIGRIQETNRLTDISITYELSWEEGQKLLWAHVIWASLLWLIVLLI
jgi:hypothetical protein